MPQAPDLQTLLSSWDLTPDILVPTVAVLAIYATGLARRPGTLEARLWRHVAFFWGVMAVFFSLASPLDAFADRLFFMHQVQHMLIRVVGPMLIALSQPQGVLIAGLPSWIRRNGLGPLLASRVPSLIFGFLTRPVMVTVLFVASLYLWQWPRLHNLAILNEGVHYVMHVTMLAAGLLFFWRVFDQRPAPQGTRFGVRLMMLWVAVLANIPIGAFTTFKSHELYPAYDVAGRLFHISAMDDERLGGFIMWAPSSMMMLLAVLVVIHTWAGHEEKLDDRRVAAALHPSRLSASSTAAPPSRSKNRALALGLGAFAACVLAATLAIGVIAVHGQMSGQGGHLASGHLDPRYRLAVSVRRSGLAR
ncbi:MAG TPA: cytochrome c oxidase assembly protein [Caulobacteraceae bacterium]|jgi:putative membrane protein